MENQFRVNLGVIQLHVNPFCTSDPLNPFLGTENQSRRGKYRIIAACLRSQEDINRENKVFEKNGRNLQEGPKMNDKLHVFERVSWIIYPPPSEKRNFSGAEKKREENLNSTIQKQIEKVLLNLSLNGAASKNPHLQFTEICGRRRGRESSSKLRTFEEL